MAVIAPSDPKHSFILYKVDGDPNATNGVDCSALACASSEMCGVPMPNGGPQLSAGDRDTLRRWIAQGAKND
jgi:hypothetical protein